VRTAAAPASCNISKPPKREGEGEGEGGNRARATTPTAEAAPRALRKGAHEGKDGRAVRGGKKKKKKGGTLGSDFSFSFLFYALLKGGIEPARRKKKEGERKGGQEKKFSKIHSSFLA